MDWSFPAAGDGSVRSVDAAGFMHVGASHISKEAVNEYYGWEIPGSLEAGLDQDRLYRVYRPGAELAAAAKTFDGLPLLMEHWDDTAEEPMRDKRVGATGTDGRFDGTYLDNSLHVLDAEAIREIEAGRFRQISCSYLYDPVFKPGVFGGSAYDLSMSNIRGLHVALVPEGRVGPDVAVADSKPKGIDMGRMQELVGELMKMVGRGASDEGLPPEEVQGDQEPPAEAGATDPLAEVYAFLDALEDKESAAKVKALLERLAAQGAGGDEEPPKADEPPKDEDPPDEGGSGPPPPTADRKASKPPWPRVVDADKLRAKVEAEVVQRVMAKHKAMVRAANDVRPLAGAVDALSFDDEAAIYRHGLKAAGVETKATDAAALKDMVTMAVRMRTAAKAPARAPEVGTLEGPFAGLKNIKTRAAASPRLS
jgi:hypothetical protein